MMPRPPNENGNHVEGTLPQPPDKWTASDLEHVPDPDVRQVFQAGMERILVFMEYRVGYHSLQLATELALPPAFVDRCLYLLLCDGEVYRHERAWRKNSTRARRGAGANHSH